MKICRPFGSNIGPLVGISGQATVLSLFREVKIDFDRRKLKVMEGPLLVGGRICYGLAMESIDGFKVTEVRLGEETINWQGYDSHQWELAVDKMVDSLSLLGDVGTRFLLGFGRNTLLDLLVRAAAAKLGFVPVTTNWQADTTETLRYKASKTNARFVILHESCPQSSKDVFHDPEFGLEVLRVDQDMLDGIGASAGIRDENVSGAAMTLFTSGTTGAPKGVELSHESYRANWEIFKTFLNLGEEDSVRVVLVNPLHHANSTSMSNWALRRPGTELFLVSHYGTQYWDALARIAASYSGRIIAPLVARHFEYLENLIQDGRLELRDEHKIALEKTEFLVGSAPVGPQTVERFKRLTGRLPRVRFGSTELCLQALGIAQSMDEEETLRAFQAGWQHRYAEQELVGYYIGRTHAPYTDADIVESVSTGDAGYMKSVEEGQSGLLVVRSDSAMAGYVDEPGATKAAFCNGWYTGLGDVAFYLTNKDTQERDYYWVSRSTGLMIRGGANYSCVQLEAELHRFCVEHFKWVEDDFDLAVVGHKLGSEHEDACCVLLDMKSMSRDEAEAYAQRLMIEAPMKVSKGAKPDRVALGQVPRNFKGAIVRPKIREYFDNSLQEVSESSEPGTGERNE